jgi:hypothetical protein
LPPKPSFQIRAAPSDRSDGSAKPHQLEAGYARHPLEKGFRGGRWRDAPKFRGPSRLAHR